MAYVLNWEQVLAVLPQIIMFCGAILALLLTLFRGWFIKWLTYGTIVLSIAWSLFCSVFTSRANELYAFNKVLFFDGYSLLINSTLLVFTLLYVISTFAEYKKNLKKPEHYVLLNLAIASLMIGVSSTNLIVIMFSIFIMNNFITSVISIHAETKHDKQMILKNFINETTVGLIMVFGVVLMYAVTKTLSTDDTVLYLSETTGAESIYIVGSLMLLLGFLFKINTVPFCFLSENIYKSTPPFFTYLLDTTMKLSLFAIFLRVIISLGLKTEIPATIRGNLNVILWFVVSLTLVVSSFSIIKQSTLRGVLFYTSVGHVGLFLMALIVGNNNTMTYTPLIVCLLCYCLMSAGLVLVLYLLTKDKQEAFELYRLKGLAVKHPVLALVLAIILLSFAGLPPTAGFVSKYYLFFAAFAGGEKILAITGIVTSLVMAICYLKIIYFMYFKNSTKEIEIRKNLVLVALVSVLAGVILCVGIMPAFLLKIAAFSVLNF